MWCAGLLLFRLAVHLTDDMNHKQVGQAVCGLHACRAVICMLCGEYVSNALQKRLAILHHMALTCLQSCMQVRKVEKDPFKDSSDE